MKKIAALFLSLTLVFAGMTVALADDGGYTITDYSVNAVLHENNTVTQTEVIEVDFSEARHGIYRSIPLTMYVGDQQDGESVAKEYHNRVTDLSVEGAPYEVSEEDGYQNIRIGDADETVTGKHTYTITFTYSMPDDRIKDRDFLFYSVLGSEWKTTIDHFSFSMTFDKPLADDALENFQVYSGSYGGTENDLNVQYDLTANEISGEVDGVSANEAVTLFVNLPQGYFVGARTLPTWPAWAAALLALALGAWILFRSLVSRQKEPVQTVEFYPPDGISSAEVGYIIDNSADESDLLSLIPWWAEKGYLSIEEKPDGKGRSGKHAELVLHKEKKLPKDAPEYSKQLFRAFFPNEKEYCNLNELKSSFATKLSDSCSLLSDEFVDTRSLYTGTARPLVFTLLACLALAAALTFCSQVSWGSNLLFAGIAAAALFLVAVSSWNRQFSTHFKKASSKVVGVLLSGLGLLFSFACMILFCADESCIPVSVLLVLFAVTALACLLCGRMIRPTEYNIEMTGKLMGLKHFIETAEVPRLKELLDENPAYYYDVLPYAMVFGLTDKWAKQFETLTVEKPNWYYSYNPLFDIWYFNRIMRDGVQAPIDHVKAEAAREAAKASASSGGGGGFSGGGGGGGGGGSW